MVISPSFHCAGVPPTRRVQVTRVLGPVSALLISRPQTKIDVWLANLSADVLISGTYVKPLFVMQLWGKKRALSFSATLYKNKEQRWGWVIISRCLEGPFAHQGLYSQSRTGGHVAFSKPAKHFLHLLLFVFWWRPALPPDQTLVMTVIHHALSAAALLSWCHRPVQRSFPSNLLSLGPGPWQGN